MKRALLLDTKTSTITQSLRKPEDERHLSFDIKSFDQEDFELEVNTLDGSNAASMRLFSDIDTYMQIYAPYPVELTLNGSLILTPFTGLFILSSALTSLRVRNLSTDQSVVCAAIFA